uniref:DNA-directed DNA polymerase n=1 Tax=Lygus hesperus TaxID=30085 RepID=A0A0A9XHA7_LYGHE
MVRRDWCPLSKKVSDAVLERILYAKDGEDILDYIIGYVHRVAQDVRGGDVYTLREFVISKSLTKEPELYKGGSFPHAAVAQRMKARKELVRVGDLIPYVICTGEKLNERAYHVDEVRQNETLRVDA